MSLLGGLARAYIADRMIRGSRGPSRRRSPWSAPPPPPRMFGPPRRRRQSSGFGFFGPFPTYRTQTRRGSQVSVSGCCLPIPLSLAVGGALAVRRSRRAS